MSPAVALAILTWAALVILYLGLAATLREVRLLRAELVRLKAGGTAPPAIEVALPSLAPEQGAQVVLAADAGCPSCHQAAEALAGYAEALPVPPVLLTYEAAEEWEHVGDRLRVVQDRAAWSQLSHLAPPVLLLVAPGGAVRELALPVGGKGVSDALSTWGVRPIPERS